jgi:tetratricopeptide (TPR) repeat protein
LDPQNPKFLGENILYEAVKSRLEDTPTEPWFMVIDGLDHSQEARVIEPLLPRRGYGWMLFTTRNRYLVRNLVELKKQACAEVELPSEKASLQMFKHYVDGSLVDEEEVHAKKLLNLLCCPDIIRRAAEDMNVHKRTCEHMCDEMMDDIFTKVEHLRPNFAEFLLKPILTSPLRPGCEWSGELELLFQLCMFNNQIGVDFKLIGVEYERGSHSNVRHMLDTLRGCFLISVRERSGDTERPLYLVNKIVEMAVRTWIKTNEGQIGFLARYNKALSMMFRSYDQRKRADQRNKRNKPGKATSSSNRYKAFFLPHFEGFVTFTSVAHEPFDFRLYYRAVQAVVTFSSTLLDADRHDDAIRVLEFARRHYKWTDLEAQDDIRKQRCRGAYFALNQRLVKAYLSGPREDKSRSDFTNAENLVQTLQREATTADDTFPCAGKTLRKWDLSLDMVRVLWESGKLDKAWQQFEEIKKINIVIDKRDAILPDFQIPSNPQDSKYEEKIRQELQRLATMVKCEQGLLNLATGQEHYRKKDMREARRSWEAAREAFLDAKVAVEQWFSHDSRQLANIELHLAEAYMKVGRKEDLCAVVSTFERELEQVSERVGNRCRRACDIEYKLNAARLERGSHDDVEQVELSSRQLFEHNQITLGSDHDRTIECAAQLREAYVRR